MTESPGCQELEKLVEEAIRKFEMGQKEVPRIYMGQFFIEPMYSQRWKQTIITLFDCKSGDLIAGFRNFQELNKALS